MYSLSIFLFLTILAFPTHAARQALVVGNSNYPGKLYLGENPRNDATAIGAALHSVGFTITSVFDVATQTEFETAVNNFAEQLSPQDEVVFYYSGHGLQVQGKNYLVPTQARMVAEAQVPVKAVEVDYVLGALTRAGTGVVIIDACRDNPFKNIFKGEPTVGMKPQGAPAGFLLAFAADENQRAATGEGEVNSPYVKHLKEQISQPGVSVFEVFTNVRNALDQESGGAQQPMFSSRLNRTYCFAGCQSAEPVPKSLQLVQLTVRSNIKRDQNRLFNNSVLLSNSTSNSFHLFKKLYGRIDLLYTMILQASNNDLFAADQSLYQIRALPSLNHSNRKIRKKAREINEQGIALLKARDYKGAAQLFREALTLDYADPEIAGNFGYALMLQGKIDEAKQLFIHSLALNPERSISWVTLGQAIAPIGSLDEVIGCFHLALRYSKNIESLKITITSLLNEPNQPPKVLSAIEHVMSAR